MSYVSTPAGLQTVAVDGVTIEGDGTPADPLVAVGGGGSSVYSVAKTVFSNGALPPVVSPATVFPTTDSTWFTQTITSTDADFSSGDIRINTDGTYKISMQLSFDNLSIPSQHDVQINFGLTDAPPNPPLYENITFQHFDSGGVGQFSCEFQTVLELTAGTLLQPTYVLTGTAGATLNYYIGAEAGFILVERLA